MVLEPRESELGTYVLVVDDAPAMRRVVSLCLSMDGRDVREAASAEEAWSLMQQDRPAIILSDIQMIGRTGLELLQDVRQHETLRDVPFVIMTGDAVWERLALDAGATAVLFKPFTLLTLRDTLSDALRQQAHRR
jgi:CheY-like chemotaxis protein